MSYGLQISASGAAASLYRQDIYANNLANLETAAFKPDMPRVQPRLAARQEDGLPHLPSDKLLERLGGGVLMRSNLVNFQQGSTKPTGNPLDLAIEGAGFFALQGTHDSAQGDTVLLTRDGRFTRDAGGRLVSATGGQPVLDGSGRPIVLASGSPVSVSGDGTIRQGGAEVARLRIVSVPDVSRLKKAGGGTYSAPADAMAGETRASGRVRQSAVEQSGVSEVRELMSVTGAARDVDANISMIQQHDRLMDRAINSLGRVA